MRVRPLNCDQAMWNAIREILGLGPLYDPGTSNESEAARFMPRMVAVGSRWRELQEAAPKPRTVTAGNGSGFGRGPSW